jgi:hypothetical protein
MHPMAHLRHDTASSLYAPTDIIMQLCLPHNGRDPSLCDAVWSGAIDALVKELDREKKHLVIRNHSHIDFFMGASTVIKPYVSNALTPRHRLLEILSVRHPLDSWISIQDQGWHRHFRSPSLGEFCNRALGLLDACRNFPILRYEDFTLDPLSYLNSLSIFLEIPMANQMGSDPLNLNAISISGDSGRRSNKIAPRERRIISQSVESELRNQMAMPQGESPYLILCSRLGYDPSWKASHPFTLKHVTVPNLMPPLSMTDDPHEPSSSLQEQSPSKSYPEELRDLKSQLLRNEQKYFEQLDRQAAKLEQLDSELLDVKTYIHQSDLIRLQLRQAHEELELLYQQLESTERQLRIKTLQLKQAQEELGLNADYMQYLQQWRHELEYSMKNQLKLICKTLLIRFVEHVRWILPTGFLRSHKLTINSFLRR